MTIFPTISVVSIQAISISLKLSHFNSRKPFLAQSVTLPFITFPAQINGKLLVTWQKKIVIQEILTHRIFNAKHDLKENQ